MAIAQEDLPQFGLADRLRKGREHAGMTIEQMAAELTARGRKTSSSAVSLWEKGSQPRKLMDLVPLWAAITGIPTDWYFRQLSSYLTLAEIPDGQMELALGDHSARVVVV